MPRRTLKGTRLYISTLKQNSRRMPLPAALRKVGKMRGCLKRVFEGREGLRRVSIERGGDVILALWTPTPACLSNDTTSGTSDRSFVRSLVHSFIHLFIRSFICSFVCSFVHLFNQLFIRSFTNQFINCSFVRSLISSSIVHLFVH